MGRTADSEPMVGERLYFKDEFLPQARARELGVASGTVLRWDTVMMTVTLEADDGTVFTTRRDYLRFTAPAGLSQRRESVKAPASKRRKEAIDPAKGEELTFFGATEVHRDPG